MKEMLMDSGGEERFFGYERIEGVKGWSCPKCGEFGHLEADRVILHCPVSADVDGIGLSDKNPNLIDVPAWARMECPRCGYKGKARDFDDGMPETLQMDAETLKWLRGAIAEMKAMYADESRSDWYDADDLAREIAEKVGDLIDEEDRK